MFLLSSISGYTIYICRPSFICSLMNLKTLNLFLSNLCTVVISFLPGGNSSIKDISRSPYALMASVLGIGVAVIISMCGGVLLFAHNLLLCATPNLCCSSIIASPKFLNFTLS